MCNLALSLEREAVFCLSVWQSSNNPSVNPTETEATPKADELKPIFGHLDICRLLKIGEVPLSPGWPLPVGGGRGGAGQVAAEGAAWARHSASAAAAQQVDRPRRRCLRGQLPPVTGREGRGVALWGGGTAAASGRGLHVEQSFRQAHLRHHSPTWEGERRGSHSQTPHNSVNHLKRLLHFGVISVSINVINPQQKGSYTVQMHQIWRVCIKERE